MLQSPKLRPGITPIGPVAPNWAPRPFLHTMVQVDWEPGPIESVPNWASHLFRSALYIYFFSLNILAFSLFRKRSHFSAFDDERHLVIWMSIKFFEVGSGPRLALVPVRYFLTYISASVKTGSH